MKARTRIGLAAVALVLATGAVASPSFAAERPGNIEALKGRAQAVGFLLTDGGDHPFPQATEIRRRTGFGVSPNAYRCPHKLGGLTFFRQPGGLGLTLLWRGRRHVAVVDLGPGGQIIGAVKIPCRARVS